jgi:small subunit ribosomal protein S7
MSRRKAAPKRVILPDPLFGSELLAKFINTVMRSGKKSIAERIVYGALEDVIQKTRPSSKDDDGDDGKRGSIADLSIYSSNTARQMALEKFNQALNNIMPVVEVRSRRVGGSTYQVPVEIRAERRRALGMRWLADYASKRGEKSMTLRLANEIVDAIAGRGAAVKKREDVHRMAEANKAFSHYNW